MTDNTFTYVLHIEATPDEVWQALTSGEFTEKYWGGRHITSDWKEGSEVQHIRPDGGYDWRGKVLIANRPKELSYTWEIEDEPTSKVTFKLMAQGANVRLMLIHENLPADAQDYAMATEGWMAILSSLKTLLETGKPLAFPHWQG